MERRVLAAITAAIEAYISAERLPRQRGTIVRLNRWKMAARNESAILGRNMTARADPRRLRMCRYSHR